MFCTHDILLMEVYQPAAAAAAAAKAIIVSH
jgi:hypothetical protein